jgi:hypothetical protein
MKLRLKREFPWVLDHAQRFLLRRLTRSYESYHPVFLGSEQLASGERSCMDRWELIANAVMDDGIESFIDLGCAEGYFVQQAATNFSCFSIGIDADIRRLTIAKISTSLNKIMGAGFMSAFIDKKLLSRLPQFDVILFLSVLHHIMYEHGVEYSRDILSCIRARTKKYLVFDMGQSDETNHSWSKLLPPMDPDPKTWIASLLISAGFNKVECVGESDAYKNQIRRHLFIARP